MHPTCACPDPPTPAFWKKARETPPKKARGFLFAEPLKNPWKRKEKRRKKQGKSETKKKARKSKKTKKGKQGLEGQGSRSKMRPLEALLCRCPTWATSHFLSLTTVAAHHCPSKTKVARNVSRNVPPARRGLRRLSVLPCGQDTWDNCEAKIILRHSSTCGV